VLQALILTEGEKMVTTPTYHVFEMFTPHQDAERISASYDTGTYTMDGKDVPHISVSASQKDGEVFISIVNLSHESAADVVLDLRGAKLAFKSGRVITSGTLDARNTFDFPDALVPKSFDSVINDGEKFSATIPQASVTVLSFG
jgi:alpha-N-arabinofuranosidase